MTLGIFAGQGKISIFTFLTSNKEIMDIPMIWIRIRTFASNWGGLPGSVVPYTNYCFVRKGDFDCQQLAPHMNYLVNTYKEPIVRTPYGGNVLNRFQKHQVLLIEDENWKTHTIQSLSYELYYGQSALEALPWSLACGIGVIHTFKYFSSNGFHTGPIKRVGW